VVRPIYFGSNGGGDAGGGGGGGGDVGAALAAVSMIMDGVLNIVTTGIESEYSGLVRSQYHQSHIPRLMQAIKTLQGAVAYARGKGDRTLERYVMSERPGGGVVPGPFGPVWHSVEIPSANREPEVDAWIGAVEKFGTVYTGPSKDKGGNLDGTRQVTQAFFMEALMYSTIPPAVQSALTDATQENWVQIVNNSSGAVANVFARKNAMRSIYGWDNPDAARDVVPFPVRDVILRKYLEWQGQGLLPLTTPLPPWVFGFNVYRSDDHPPAMITIGGFLLLQSAVANGLITSQNVHLLGGEQPAHSPEAPAPSTIEAGSERVMDMARARAARRFLEWTSSPPPTGGNTGPGFSA